MNDWSPANRHIQTAVITINSHGHVMYLPVTYIFNTSLLHNVFIDYCSGMFEPQFLAMLRVLVRLCSYICQLIWQMLYMYD